MGLRNRKRKFPLPLVFFEQVAELFQDIDDKAPPRQVLWGIVRCLWSCHVRFFIRPSDLKYVWQRIEKARAAGQQTPASEEDEKAAQEAHERFNSKDFEPESYGEYFIRWASKLPPYQMCLYLSEGDPCKAWEFYTEVDRDDVLEAYEVKTSWELESVRYRVEAALYGFGGGYKKKGGGSSPSSPSSSSSDGSETVYDMTTPEGQAAGLAALKRKGY